MYGVFKLVLCRKSIQVVFITVALSWRIITVLLMLLNYSGSTEVNDTEIRNSETLKNSYFHADTGNATEVWILPTPVIALRSEKYTWQAMPLILIINENNVSVHLSAKIHPENQNRWLTSNPYRFTQSNIILKHKFGYGYAHLDH